MQNSPEAFFVNVKITKAIPNIVLVILYIFLPSFLIINVVTGEDESELQGRIRKLPENCVSVELQGEKMSEWTETVDDLQFRAKLTKSKLKFKENIDVVVYIRNVGVKEIAVLHPAKLSSCEANIIFHPYVLYDERRLDFDWCRLESEWDAEQYIILKPGENTCGRFERSCNMPIGNYYIYFRVRMASLRDSVELSKWEKSDIDRILPTVWQQGDVPLEIGPIPLYIEGKE